MIVKPRTKGDLNQMKIVPYIILIAACYALTFEASETPFPKLDEQLNIAAKSNQHYLTKDHWPGYDQCKQYSVNK